MATSRWNSRDACPTPKNITAIKDTVANKLQDSTLIHRMDKMNLNEIKKEFINILSDESTKISKHTKIKYKSDCEKQYSKTKMCYFLTNFLLKADGLGIN